MMLTAMVGMAVMIGGNLGQGAGQPASDPKTPLTDAQIAAKFKAVPAFVVATATGNVVTHKGPDGKTTVGVFLGKKEADNFAARVRSQPQMSGVATRLVSLGDLVNHKAATVVYVPVATEIPLGLKVLQAEKPDAKQLEGVPIYYLMDSKGGYVTMTTGGVPRVPIFFSHAEAEAVRMQAAGTALKDSKLRISTLEGLMQVLRTAPSVETDALSFVPHKDALAEARKMIDAGSGG